MATVRTFNLTSIVVAGTRVEFLQGRLTYRTSDSGRTSWDASVVLRGVPPVSIRNLSTTGDFVKVEFEDGRLVGQASVSNIGPSADGYGTGTRLELTGTGDLEGWPV